MTERGLPRWEPVNVFFEQFLFPKSSLPHHWILSMKSCNLSKLGLFIALLNFLLAISAGLQQEQDHRSLSIGLRRPASPRYGGWRSASAHGSSHAEALDRLTKAVEATKVRVGALKTGSLRRHRPNINDNYVEPLYPRGYGGYSIPVSLGTPPQELSVIMDTGSDLVWVPCTGNYTCEKCPTTGDSPPIFIPEKSSSARLASCANPNCKSLHGNNTERLCLAQGKCAGTLSNCSREACPAYGLQYGKGSTAGLLLSETLTLALKDGGNRGIERFGVGCSLISSQQPSGIGIAGFGRGGLSLPSQLGSVIGDKFAYCLINHIYDNQNQSSTMVLGDDAVPKGVPLHYTPFLFNSKAHNSAYGVYYYIGLSGISIGRRFLKLPPELLEFDVKGNGGTIIDSGTTFTFTDEKIFNEIAGGFDSQVAYSRAKAIEAKTGLGLCYDISSQDNISVPQFTFHFQGGSRMSLAVENYLIIVGKAVCLTILNTQNGNLDGDIGPAVILGNYQQQNFYILYDREKNRLGFTQQNCKTSG